ncbi:unnamed protein product [Arabis nemorensis]|uniref:RNase H type-1 domain-containing protein n=1 Tax=Arabis nemorensis TaxID=586526 RepID=A0A565BR31_9BRAS|nr:unnamed protein product [Arabis nemorensis]
MMMRYGFKFISSSPNDMQHIPSASGTILWRKPSPGIFKCNLWAAWVNDRRKCGASWIFHDHLGQPLFRNNRSFSTVSTKLESELFMLHWTVESLKNLHFQKVCFECSSESLKENHLKPKPESSVSLLDSVHIA